MQERLMYIELKTGHNNNGPAWIGKVNFSKTATTIYFNNKAFKKAQGVSGNYFDIENGDEYWISGIKKNGEDRHWTGKGKIKIKIDKSVVEDYLKKTGEASINKSKFELIEIVHTRDKKDFIELENKKLY